MNTIFCSAQTQINGRTIEVFAYLTNEQLYAGSAEEKISVCIDHGGRMEEVLVNLGDLADITEV